jgi:hypothetical protein
MKNLTLEQIILLIIFILGPLISILMRRLGRRRQNQSPEREPVTLMRRQGRISETAPSIARVSRTRGDASEPPTVSAPRYTSRFNKSSLLGTRRELRRGIIIMTLLGPCRASEPPE